MSQSNNKRAGELAHPGSTAPTLKRRWIRRLFPLATLVVATLLILLFAEIVFRVVVGPSDVSLFEYRSDTARYRVMKPHTSGHVYGVPIKINGAGFRSDREYSTHKSQGTKRVVVLGDSMTVCAGAPFDKLTTTLLEKRLTELCAPQNIEVYNLGCGGYGILHYVATLKEVALSYQPDLLLLFLFPDNDFEVHWYDEDRLYLEQNAKPSQPLPVPEIEQPWYKELFVYRVMAPRVVPLVRRIGAMERKLGPSTYDQTLSLFRDKSENWHRSIDGLKQISEIAQQAGVPCRVVLLQPNWATYTALRPIQEGGTQACREAGLVVYSMMEAFEATGHAPGHFAVNLIDNHPGAQYGEVAAQSIIDQLIKDGLVERFKLKQ